MTKVHQDIEAALSCVKNGHTLMVGGFGLIGAPLTLIDGLGKKDVAGLTVISNNLGEKGKGLGALLSQKKIKKAIGSYFTSNREIGEFYQRGEIELELLPQGTLAESIRAGGAGIGGYYTKTGVGTDLAKGKEEREINGATYIFEPAIRANVALIRAWKADTLGNLVYYKTARNFNPAMATAADVVIAEVDEIVEPGELSPEEIVTPHLFVDGIIKAKKILTKEGVKDYG
ncbi:CoA transferase subunit A [Peribacillus frigoritolerans]|jgi:3-oxoacid CoA-transferase subunit A/3-oxoadipate CoA-transferase alpha subunit|uniref:CoA transferase subunit A n=1 Tax=Peribacillus frigoritolerans TaxID=450367 RepID=UPI000BEB80C5|nr:CoA transferase subunit A [Peribacillus frigoritolerans]MBD8136901.1 CoA transferase subunit A [Bacillus sp. CFBP 13597]PEF41331.1 succinyl-CoA--3-ketoacid-CoA transferase [Bacillus sp. AFS094228]PEO45479.1 succinyl-CoA--3-ketoacid-CoA transferase [Bacillus sp. AFS026049]MCR8871599.1 CoA transferase subunit A [Peribacillus frigoritolerans]MCY9141512.1 CoA transferase subunit A [Peribacillus frigoritolerans]